MTTVLTLEPAFFTVIRFGNWLRGQPTAGNTIHPVNYNNWPGDVHVANGAKKLNTELLAVSGTKVVLGHSEGSQVAYQWLKTYSADSTIPTSDLSFILTGNPWRKYGGVPWSAEDRLTFNPKYPVHDIARQYDGWCDYPDDTSVTQAVQNAWIGMNTLHLDYKHVQLSSARNVSWVEGNITYTVIPTPLLPLTNALTPGLNDFRVYGSQAKQKRQEWIKNKNIDLKVQVEYAYNRPVV